MAQPPLALPRRASSQPGGAVLTRVFDIMTTCEARKLQWPLYPIWADMAGWKLRDHHSYHRRTRKTAQSKPRFQHLNALCSLALVAWLAHPAPEALLTALLWQAIIGCNTVSCSITDLHNRLRGPFLAGRLGKPAALQAPHPAEALSLTGGLKAKPAFSTPLPSTSLLLVQTKCHSSHSGKPFGALAPGSSYAHLGGG